MHITSSLKMGGAEEVLCTLLKELDAERFEHHVIYFHEGPHLSCLQEMGIAQYQIKGAVRRYDPLFLIRLYNLIKKIKPDGIHSLLWAANNLSRVMGRLLGIPVISAYHNNIDQDGTIKNILDTLTLNFSDRVIAVSPGVAQSVIAQNRSWQKNIIIIPNGVNSDLLQEKNKQAARSRAPLGLGPEQFILGAVGRFVPLKRFDLLFESFAIVSKDHPHARLILLGKGPEEEKLRKYAHDMGIADRVIFIIGEPAYAYYGLFDCFAMTSDKEGISIALLEAMSFGLPCVVTHSESTHPVLESGYNGLVVPAGDTQKIAQAIKYVIENKQERLLLAQAACQTIKLRFNSLGMVRAYEALFTSFFSGL